MNSYLKKRGETNAAAAMDGAQQEDSQYRPSRIGKRITNAREKVLVYDLRGGDVFLAGSCLGMSRSARRRRVKGRKN